MDVFQFVQIAGFALAFFMAGYNLGKRNLLTIVNLFLSIVHTFA